MDWLRLVLWVELVEEVMEKYGKCKKALEKKALRLRLTVVKIKDI